MPAAWGAGLTTIAADGSVLDTWYPHLGWGVTVAEGAAESLAAGARSDERVGRTGG